MYLQKLEIQGFKSFANKVTLEFNRQLTGVVGPNGSGKSNIADAVRWVLGEQSVKLLRGKRAEDVIFAGSDLKSRLGMAEVSLFLNNEDGSAPIDYTEIVVTRRVYRDGQSEYLLNRTPVRLADIQLLLAQANFGQKTYSVIGQGMVDSILLASPAERKEFFEEATGVKQYQLKREQAIAKLTATYENMEQGEMVLREIDPRLKVLTRQVKRLERREELERELREMQKSYYHYRFHELDTRRRAAASESTRFQAELSNRQNSATDLSAKIAILEKQETGVNVWRNLEIEQGNLRQRLNELTKEQARVEAQTEVAHLKRGEGELVLLKQRLGELAANAKELVRRQEAVIHALEQEQVKLERAIKDQARAVEAVAELTGDGVSGWLEREARELLAEHADLRRALSGLASLAEAKVLAVRHAKLEERVRQFIERVKRGSVGSQDDLKRLLTEREGAVAQAAVAQSRLEALAREQEQLARELTAIQAAKIKIDEVLASGGKRSQVDSQAVETSVVKQIETVEAELKRVEQASKQVHAQAEARSGELFSLQREIEAVREAERKVSQEAHEVELELARLTTRLEDLERELAQEVPAELIRTIKESSEPEPIDEGAVALELQKLKHQFELTGGIEPEVLQEYQQTKTRFDFLTAQLDDLHQAADSLEHVIRDLDQTIEQQFLESFKVINQKFMEYFKVLFNGGKAVLLLQKAEAPSELPVTEESEEEVEAAAQAVAQATVEQSARERFLAREKLRSQLFAGVEIQATPPGKKLSSITALSGGEKALTAIGLISAIISNNPSPFVVLDEVDAALDEANSERYAAILDSLMDSTQFITITHNRATMRRASILYGVTMGEDGVSRLLSVKFDQAEELAAKGGKSKSKE